MTETMDDLDRRATEAFAGRIVRKDLVRQVKVGANVPVYVLEFLLGKYAASDDPAAIATGLQVVNQTLAENFIRPDEAETAKANLKRKGQHRIIDKVSVRLLASEDKYWAELSNFGDRFIHIPEEYVYRFQRLLQGGVWCQIDLIYDASEEEAHKRPFFIKGLRPIQVASFDLADYVAGRAQFSRDEWLDLVVRSIGLEADHFDTRTKLLYVTRLIPMVERNYNLIELGPWGTGKSFVYRETSPNAILISGGRASVPQLFVHLGTGRIGLVGMWDVVAFDEVAGIEFSDSTVVQIMKDYMESGSFARGKDEFPAEASMVFLGNTSAPPDVLLQHSHLFHDLPQAMIDPAFLDRLHFYLPGWETPKMEQRFFTQHYGFVSDYLAEALRELRRTSQVRAIDDDFLFGSHLSARDEKAVRKTVSGLLKILHPHGVWTRSDLREYLEFALEGRRRVKEQLRRLAAHDYARTDFSYIERDTGREIWVPVREQAEHTIEDLIADVAVLPSTTSVQVASVSRPSVAEVLERGEGKRVEFKSSARWHYRAGRDDEAMQHEVIRTIAGFLNAAGGTLLIGVGDDGEPLGLEHDFQAVKGHNRDGFENWLTNRLQDILGKPALHHVEVEWAVLNGKDVCRVEVQPSETPVFVRDARGDTADLYVRTNNSTRRFNTEEAMRYIGAHWRR